MANEPREYAGDDPAGGPAQPNGQAETANEACCFFDMAGHGSEALHKYQVGGGDRDEHQQAPQSGSGLQCREFIDAPDYADTDAQASKCPG